MWGMAKVGGIAALCLFHSIRSAVDLNSPAKPRVRRGMAQHRDTLSAGLDRMIPLTDQA